MARRETMTSRERLLKAVRHQVRDRVPIDLGGNQTGIHKFAYQRLLAYLGIREEMRIMDAVQQLAQPGEAVLQRFHVDTRYIAAGPASGWQGGISQSVRGGKLWHDLTDEFGVTWSMPDEQPLYMDISHHPLASATNADVSRDMEIFKPGGGYAFNGIHNIQGGVPPENIVALYDTAYECGFYE